MRLLISWSTVNWRYYDKNFCFLRHSNVSSYSWVHVNWELWLRSQSYQGKQRTIDQSSVPSQSRLVPRFHIPKGFCYKFYKGVACSGCDVMEITRLPTAIFVPPLIDDQPNLCPLPSSLPLIWIDRFLSFLDRYTPSTVRYLRDGFTAGFHLDYTGQLISVHSNN